MSKYNTFQVTRNSPNWPAQVQKMSIKSNNQINASESVAAMWLSMKRDMGDPRQQRVRLIK